MYVMRNDNLLPSADNIVKYGGVRLVPSSTTSAELERARTPRGRSENAPSSW